MEIKNVMKSEDREGHSGWGFGQNPVGETFVSGLEVV